LPAKEQTSLSLMSSRSAQKKSPLPLRQTASPHAVGVDVAKSDEVAGMIAAAESTLGGVDVLVNKHAAALALAGEDTGPSGFTDDRVRDPQLVALRQRLDIIPVDRLRLSGPSEVIVVLKEGTSLTASVAANVPVPDSGLGDQWLRVVSKFRGLVDPVLGAGRSQRLIDLVSGFASMDSIGPLSAATAR
jgi:NAD(P)-dependent dehydrogenase (short-subunit alcohol dehydrogenase family)